MVLQSIPKPRKLEIRHLLHHFEFLMERVYFSLRGGLLDSSSIMSLVYSDTCITGIWDARSARKVNIGTVHISHSYGWLAFARCKELGR